jgi:hypothetical protein
LDEYSFNPRRMESFERGIRCKHDAELFNLVEGATGRAIKVERGKAERLVKRRVVVLGVVVARYKCEGPNAEGRRVFRTSSRGPDKRHLWGDLGRTPDPFCIVQSVN